MVPKNRPTLLYSEFGIFSGLSKSSNVSIFFKCSLKAPLIYPLPTPSTAKIMEKSMIKIE